MKKRSYFEVRNNILDIVVGAFSTLSFEDELQESIDYETYNLYLYNKKVAICKEKNLRCNRFFEVREISKERFAENYWWMV